MYHVYLSGDVLMAPCSAGAAPGDPDEALSLLCVASDEGLVPDTPLHPTIVNAHNDVMTAMASFLMIASHFAVGS